MTPPVKPPPNIVQSTPAGTLPSHCSPSSRNPLPQSLQALSSSAHLELHLILFEPSGQSPWGGPGIASPSHISPPSITPLPQSPLGQAPQSSGQFVQFSPASHILFLHSEHTPQSSEQLLQVSPDMVSQTPLGQRAPQSYPLHNEFVPALTTCVERCKTRFTELRKGLWG